MQDLLTTGAIINGIIILSIGLIAYFKNKKNLLNKTFAVFCIFLASWAFSYFLAKQKINIPDFYFHLGALFTATAWLAFTSAVLNIRKKGLIILGYLFNLVRIVSHNGLRPLYSAGSTGSS